MAETRIAVIGCGGRMGRMLIADIMTSETCVLAGGAAKPGSAAIGQDLGELAGIGRIGMAATGDARQVLRDSDVAIDFTNPEATDAYATLAAELGRPIVIGTTGLSGEQETAIRHAAERVPVVWAANTSLGINLLFGLVEQVAARLGPEWDIEIMEMHHRAKVDAPSGTAPALGPSLSALKGGEGYFAVAGLSAARQRLSTSRKVAARSRRIGGARKSPMTTLLPCDASTSRFDSARRSSSTTLSQNG